MSLDAASHDFAHPESCPRCLAAKWVNPDFVIRSARHDGVLSDEQKAAFLVVQVQPTAGQQQQVEQPALPAAEDKPWWSSDD